jgi:hypothetical protein
MKIDVTENEGALLLAALSAVTPSGGGGREHSLLQRLRGQTGIHPELELILQLQRQAYDEYKGAFT